MVCVQLVERWNKPRKLVATIYHVKHFSSASWELQSFFYIGEKAERFTCCNPTTAKLKREPTFL